MRCENLDFEQLPGQHPLFLSYLRQDARVAGFYSRGLHLDPDSVERRVSKVLSSSRLSRRSLIGSLSETQKLIQAPEKALSRVSSLKSEECLAVLTGQQVGLFGGPSLAVYKAATAISLAQRVESLGYRCIPVFWLASDDSDFEEVCSTVLAGQHGTPQNVDYLPPHLRAQQMAGTVGLEEIESSLAELQANFGRLKTAFADEAVELVRASYARQRDFRAAFGRWISHLFREYGLVVFDPLASFHRKELARFYSEAVFQRKTILERLHHRARELRSGGWPVQVHFDDAETLLFWMHGNERFKVEFRNGNFRCKAGKPRTWSQQELLAEIEEEPESFGPSALLRPILQDHLFPTLTYVGGPAEIAYFSQVNAISGVWELETSIAPRASFTVVDRKSSRLLGKYGLKAEDVLTRPRAWLTEKVIRQEESDLLLDRFDALESHLAREGELLQEELRRLEKPLADMMEKAGRKSAYHVHKVRSRFVENFEERQPRLKDQITYLTGRLLPGGGLQERTLNFNQLLAEEGKELLREILSRAEAGGSCHTILTVPAK